MLDDEVLIEAWWQVFNMHGPTGHYGFKLTGRDMREWKRMVASDAGPYRLYLKIGMDWVEITPAPDYFAGMHKPYLVMA